MLRAPSRAETPFGRVATSARECQVPDTSEAARLCPQLAGLPLYGGSGAAARMPKGQNLKPAAADPVVDPVPNSVHVKALHAS